MALGQIDPARLQGDALRRWYLRGPAVIEEERKRAAELDYNTFFGRAAPGAPATSARAEGTVVAEEGEDGLRSTSVDNLAYRGAPGALARNSVERPGRETPHTCINCHGRFPPPPLPPPFGPLPWPIGPIPSFRDIHGGARGRPDRDRNQCEMQERQDRGICAQQPSDRARAVCNETATERRVHCNETGEIGEPELFRARRKDGRRWP